MPTSGVRYWASPGKRHTPTDPLTCNGGVSISSTAWNSEAQPGTANHIAMLRLVRCAAYTTLAMRTALVPLRRRLSSPCPHPTRPLIKLQHFSPLLQRSSLACKAASLSKQATPRAACKQDGKVGPLGAALRYCGHALLCRGCCASTPSIPEVLPRTWLERGHKHLFAALVPAVPRP